VRRPKLRGVCADGLTLASPAVREGPFRRSRQTGSGSGRGQSPISAYFTAQRRCAKGEEVSAAPPANDDGLDVDCQTVKDGGGGLVGELAAPDERKENIMRSCG
jgi:hypothetical protein